jgi:chemotaxis protein CheZ
MAMPVRRKVFRIEEMQSAASRAPATEPASATPDQLIAELAALRGLMERRSEAAPASEASDRRGNSNMSAPDTRPEPGSSARAASEASDGRGNSKVRASNGAHPGDAYGLRQLKDETDSIHRAIARTKEEIAALHIGALDHPPGGRASRELDAVAGGAEHAIQQILAAVEDIDETANTLSATLKNEQERALAHEIRDQVIRIFEACNFQDLAGQRITKVLATLKFIEDRVARMMDIWGGIDAFKDLTEAAIAARNAGPVLLNGPKLEGDVGHASQDEIDRLFGASE